MLTLLQRDMRVFLVVWFGQVVSLVGSSLTSFTLGLWVYEQTGSATQFALIGLSTVLPRILLSPFAGVIADRWDRQRLMILSDAGAGLSTLVIVLLLAAGTLEIWHIYLTALVNAVFGVLQWPAYAAATTMLVPREQLGRANGLVQFGQAIAEIAAPTLAGFLMVVIGVPGVITIDFLTFIFAVMTLLLVRVPPMPDAGVPRQEEWVPVWQDARLGWRYLRNRSGLMGLLWFFAVVNFLWSMVGALIVPLLSGFATSDVLGAIISIAGLGMLVGSVVMSAWGGPARMIYGVLVFELASGFCFVLMGLRPSAILAALGVFGAHFTIAIINGSNQTIWQRKVPPAMQGRVFGLRQMIARSAAPLAYIIAGPLADHLFRPLLVEGGTLAGSLGLVLGTGVGRGVGLMFVLMGLVKITVSLAGFVHPRVRLIEQELPDVEWYEAQPTDH